MKEYLCLKGEFDSIFFVEGRTYMLHVLPFKDGENTHMFRYNSQWNTYSAIWTHDRRLVACKPMNKKKLGVLEFAPMSSINDKSMFTYKMTGKLPLKHRRTT